MQHSLGLYGFLDRFQFLGYRGKIMALAFLGTHIPLIAVSGWVGFLTTSSWSAMATVLLVTLAATLVGTALTLLVLSHLLRPVIMTSDALRSYRVDRQTPDLPTDHKDAAGTLMADAVDAIKHLERTRNLLETVDDTTGLINLQGFEGALSARRDENAIMGVVRFETYNRLRQTFNSEAAEEVMRTLSLRLVEQTRRGTILARISETDFALLMGSLDEAGGESWDWLVFHLNRILEDISGEVEIDDLTFQPQIFGGIAAHSAGADVALVFSNAIAAATRASMSTPVIIHSEEARDDMRDRFSIEQDLRRALRDNQFELHFQPVMDFGKGRASQAEALIRWNSPERGMVAPGAFIPVAEASGLINEIGLWVLREACRQASDWGDDMRVAVNLGARQFLDPDLKWHISEAVETAGICPTQLEIELTESVAMTDHDHTYRAFNELRDMGVTIAIDDFGTGYASMSYLRRLPFHKLKIDREFVDRVDTTPGSQAICSALIELGRGLDLKVLAEGTERHEEVAYLRGKGCELFQGYFFSRPVPGCEFKGAINKLAA